jgi:lipoprotein-anchoring transpeptidase ErfK/SrfK
VRKPPAGSRIRRRTWFGLGLAALVAIALVVMIPMLGETRPGEESKAAAARLPEVGSAGLPGPAQPSFVPGKPKLLRPSTDLTRWAPVRAPVTARVRPNKHAASVTVVSTRTPEGTSNIVLVLGDHLDPTGALWIHVRLSVLGHANTGWVPREALGGYETVRTQLVIDLESLRATLFRRGKPVFRSPVGVGKPSWPTPSGHFYIRNKLTGYASPEYGPVAFGTSARSRVLTDWPAGGYVGIHGTDQPSLIPGRVSHGCIRLRNEDIRRLSRLMPVGTPLTIRG